MIVIKYEKRGTARFVSHIDVLRAMAKICRRAELSVNYSKGFNPHPNLYFSPPIPLGIGSVAEYLVMDIDGLIAEECLSRFNRGTLPGMSGISAFKVDKNPNYAGLVTAAEYIVPLKYETPDAIDGIEGLSGDYEVTYTQKGETITKQVGEMLISVREIERNESERTATFRFVLAAGQTALRADRLAAQLERDFAVKICPLDILKTALFVTENGSIVRLP